MIEVQSLTDMILILPSHIHAGALLSIVASAESLSVVIGGVAYPILFPLTLEHGWSPGTVFLMMAAFGVIPTFLVRSE